MKYEKTFKSLIFFFLLFVIIMNLEVSELVAALVRGDYSQPITEVVLLQVLLGQVLKVSGENNKK